MKKSSLKVIALTCDGSSPNPKLFRIHCYLTQDDDMNPETDVTYSTSNLFSGTENRFLYFIFDVPNLFETFKTVWNFSSISGSGKFIYFQNYT